LGPLSQNGYGDSQNRKSCFKGSSWGQEVGQASGGNELGSTKKLPKIPKGEKEEISKPLNPKSKEGWALPEKESSKGEASKDNVQVVEQFGSTFDYSKLNEKENSEAINILKKPIKASKWMEESKRA